MALAYVPAPFACQLPNCDVFPFDTQADLDLHLAEHFTDNTGTPASVVTPKLVAPASSTVTDRRGRFETVENGFGGSTTRTISRPRTANPPTAKQTDFLRSLLAERVGVADAEEVRNDLNLAREAGELTSTVVSAAITRLLAIAKPRQAQTPMPDVPEGRYAFTADAGHTAFCKVERPVDGTWAGFVFVKLLLGAPKNWRTEKLPIPTQKAILAKIVAFGVPESMKRFGDEHGTCGACDSPLSLKRSIDAGYGEICAGKHGWAY